MNVYRVKKRSARSEKRAAVIFQGRRQPASGALPVAAFKGDVVSAEFLVEDKTTLKQSYAVKVALWRKIREEAFRAGRKPCLRINFEGCQALYVLDEATMIDLLCRK